MAKSETPLSKEDWPWPVAEATIHSLRWERRRVLDEAEAKTKAIDKKIADLLALWAPQSDSKKESHEQ